MKHVRVVSRQTPSKAVWWLWGVEIKNLGTIGTYVNALFGFLGTLDPRDV